MHDTGRATPALIVYVSEHCPFSPMAVSRARRVAHDFEALRVVVRDRSLSAAFGHAVKATPATILPDGTRVVGTPSEDRLRVLLHRLIDGGRVPNKVWYLEQNRLFHGVPQGEIEKFAHLFREVDYTPRELIFSQGDLGDAIYLLKTGHVRVYRLLEDGREVTLAILGPGDVFGELALFDEGTRRTMAEAIENAHICAASVEDFTRLMSHRPQLTMMVSREIARRSMQTETRIAGMAYKTARGRVVIALQHFAEEHGEFRDGGIRIGLRLSHQDLANYIGITRETCSIEVAKLQREGIIKVDEEHRFVILDQAKLQLGPLDKVVTTLLS